MDEDVELIVVTMMKMVILMGKVILQNAMN